MGKCAYCDKHTEELTPIVVVQKKKELAISVCSKECEQKARAFFRFAEGKGRRGIFIVGMILATLLIMFSGVSSKLMAAGIALMGLIMAIFPFGTPQTFELWGIRKTVLCVRIVGVVFIVISPRLLHLY
jgi:hypothetical protein